MPWSANSEWICDECERIVEHYHHQRVSADGRALCCLCFWQLGGSDADPHPDATEDAA